MQFECQKPGKLGPAEREAKKNHVCVQHRFITNRYKQSSTSAVKWRTCRNSFTKPRDIKSDVLTYLVEKTPSAEFIAGDVIVSQL